MRSLVLAIAGLFLSACSRPEPVAGPTLDQLAESYVRLALATDVHEPGYVDAYFGPAEWRDAAKAQAKPVAQLKSEADALIGELAGQPKVGDPAPRAAYLAANLASLRFRLDMIEGKRAPFVEEAKSLFALTPNIQPLESYDPVLTEVAALVPGEGDLAKRIAEFRSRYYVPSDKVFAVVEAAIAECRKRTVGRLSLPEGEAFRMSLVQDKSWNAYNYYQGDNLSLIEINTDLPLAIDVALVLGCHEGYPGHHVQGIYNERAYRERGQVEFSVAPLFAPSAPLNEGGADFGLELAFPTAEREAFEAETLYPLAGLDPASAPAYNALRSALGKLEGVRLTIVQRYLDGEIQRDEAAALLSRYQLIDPGAAQQSLDFADEYRSYVINYVSGEALVRGFVDRAGEDLEARWAAYEQTLGAHVLPEMLATGAPAP